MSYLEFLAILMGIFAIIAIVLFIVILILDKIRGFNREEEYEIKVIRGYRDLTKS